MPSWLIPTLIAIAALIAVFVGLRTGLTRSREGKMLAFVALFGLPLVAVTFGFSEQMERAESRTFCLSCHVMADYGRSLYIDDPSYIPARHFQNNFIPREQACYTCHTNYTMFGTITAKMHGLRHLYIQYFKAVPKPDEIKLYDPFNNRECLHCHLGARRFEEATGHVKNQKQPDLLNRVKSNELSCVSSGCHEFIHDVGSIKDATFWKESQ